MSKPYEIFPPGWAPNTSGTEKAKDPGAWRAAMDLNSVAGKEGMQAPQPTSPAATMPTAPQGKARYEIWPSDAPQATMPPFAGIGRGGYPERPLRARKPYEIWPEDFSSQDFGRQTPRFAESGVPYLTDYKLPISVQTHQIRPKSCCENCQQGLGCRGEWPLDSVPSNSGRSQSQHAPASDFFDAVRRVHAPRSIRDMLSWSTGSLILPPTLSAPSLLGAGLGELPQNLFEIGPYSGPIVAGWTVGDARDACYVAQKRLRELGDELRSAHYDNLIERTRRGELAQNCFDTLPTGRLLPPHCDAIVRRNTFLLNWWVSIANVLGENSPAALSLDAAIRRNTATLLICTSNAPDPNYPELTPEMVRESACYGLRQEYSSLVLSDYRRRQSLCERARPHLQIMAAAERTLAALVGIDGLCNNSLLFNTGLCP